MSGRLTVNEALIERNTRLIGSLLDRGYERTAGRVLGAVYESSTSGLIAQRLEEIEREAVRLWSDGQQLMGQDNPILRALIADLQSTARRNGSLMAGTQEAIIRSGYESAGLVQKAFAFPGIPEAALREVGIRWNEPDMEAVFRTDLRAHGEMWNFAFEQYGEDVPARIRDVALRGIVNGDNPIQVARDLRLAVENFPRDQANTLMRTMQLTSYREATNYHQYNNRDLSTGRIIRIAALDDRTCLACIALHGERYPVGTRIDDHYNGRCTSILEVKGVNYDIRTGEEWLNSLPEDEQRRIMGPGNYNAYKAGAVRLRQFAGPHNDPLFGPMVTERSLASILGERARGFYAGNYRSPGAVQRSPRGRPVSEALKQRGNFRIRIREQLDRTLAAIDKVHGDGELPSVPTNTGTGNTTFLGVHQPYWVRRGPGQWDLQTQALGIKQIDGDVGATYAHEIGHMLDLMALGNRNVEQANQWRTAYGSYNAFQGAPDHPMAGWANAVRQTPEYQRIQALLSLSQRELREQFPGITRKMLEYFNEPEELFARSYAQYIATRANDPAMQGHIRDITTGWTPYRQWDAQSFEPIAQEFDALFASLEWQK